MKRMHLAAAAAALVALPAMAQEAAPIVPVEMFYCDLRDGAEMSDLKAVAADFAKWAKKLDQRSQKIARFSTSSKREAIT